VGDPWLSILLILCHILHFGSHWLVLDHLVNITNHVQERDGAGILLVSHHLFFVRPLKCPHPWGNSFYQAVESPMGWGTALGCCCQSTKPPSSPGLLHAPPLPQRPRWLLPILIARHVPAAYQITSVLW
jgi:hypothetical protein